MKLLEEIVFKSNDHREHLQDNIVEVCCAINRLNTIHPDLDLDDLTSKLGTLIKYFDTILKDNEDKRDKLNTSLNETAVLACKLDLEKKTKISRFK